VNGGSATFAGYSLDRPALCQAKSSRIPAQLSNFPCFRAKNSLLVSGGDGGQKRKYFGDFRLVRRCLRSSASEKVVKFPDSRELELALHMGRHTARAIRSPAMLSAPPQEARRQSAREMHAGS
jgi:hypothetical protein